MAPGSSVQRTSSSPSPLRESAGTVARGLLFSAGASFAGAAVGSSAVGALAVQAAIAEWGATTMGISWIGADRAGSPRAVAARLAAGAAVGVAAATLGVMASLATRTAHISWQAPVLEPLALGLLVAGLTAMRDELLVRGLVWRAMRDLLKPWMVVVLCGAASVAARLGREGAAAPAIVHEALRGIMLGALWSREGGAWLPWAVNTASTWTAGELLRGGLADVRFVDSPDENLARMIAHGATALAAAWWGLRRQRKSEPGLIAGKRVP